MGKSWTKINGIVEISEWLTYKKIIQKLAQMAIIIKVGRLRYDKMIQLMCLLLRVRIHKVYGPKCDIRMQKFCTKVGGY